jgi:aminomethyltransferase
VNASNREKILAWLQSHLQASDYVKLTDRTTETAMIAVQGPKAIACAQPLVDVDIAGLAYYTGSEAMIGGQRGIVSRTGYTGEDGCELIVPAEAAVSVWEQVLANGKDGGAMAVGLGARDTLRLEAAMPLYGHELSEQINPIQAGLAFAVSLEGREFVGRQAIVAAKQDTDLPVRVGLTLTGKRAAREHYPVLSDAHSVGEITSGTFSPTLQQPIAMAYVPAKYSEPGTELSVDIRGAAEPARVVKLPFYKRSS